ncbi:hypothetical protein FACS1894172_18640 [Spirochaetia bacterium]|nr:hypothetical protein FACS1894164_19980 [Spirochaetia bacterium]GHU36100.1 hypothetical protein FACS1894172_18640 [Spirochaetia bacterium]
MLSKCEKEINEIREVIYEEMKGKTSHEYTQIVSKEASEIIEKYGLKINRQECLPQTRYFA